jgi:cytochrome b561
MSDSFPRHTRATRLAHLGLAIAIIIQLITSLAFVAPSPGKPGNIWYEIHEYSGLTAFAFVVLFWLVLTARRTGTAPGLLFPWLNGVRLRDVWADTRTHVAALARFRLPPFDEHGPLASAVHGLGLLLMTAMAATGTIYYFVNTGNPDAGGLVGLLMFVHKTLANVVWAYLIGHAGLAVVHHFTENLSLSEMWSLRKK